MSLWRWRNGSGDNWQGHSNSLHIQIQVTEERWELTAEKGKANEDFARGGSITEFFIGGAVGARVSPACWFGPVAPTRV